MTIWKGEEKYACEACIKGHRVSSCHHQERVLMHVAKKGRPVSQCPHCRTLRKSRSNHNKCVCAEHGIGKEGILRGPSPDDPNNCNCMNGLPCTCALKTFSLDTNDLPKTATKQSFMTHRRVQSYNITKPSVAARRSEGHIPNALSMSSLHPHARLNNAAHEYHPYLSQRFSHSTGDFRATHHSIDGLPGLYSAQTPTQPSTPMSTLSVPTPTGDRFIHSEQNSPARDGPYLEPQRPLPQFDPTQLRAYSSPHNLDRYSINDFSSLGLSIQDLQQQQQQTNDQGLVSAVSEHFMQPEWQTYQNQTFHNNMNIPAISTTEPGQRSSIVSLEHPGLSHSPSASTDTAESIVYPGDYQQQTPISMDPNHMSKNVDNSGVDWSMFNNETAFQNLAIRSTATTGSDYFSQQPNQVPNDSNMLDESQYLTPTYPMNANQPGPAIAAYPVDNPQVWLQNAQPIPNINLESHAPQQTYVDDNNYQYQQFC